MSTHNNESYVLSYTSSSCTLSLTRVGDIEEGPTGWIPIKIEATQGQVTLCSENFPGSSSLAPSPAVNSQ